MRARGALPHMESPPAGAHKLGHDGAVAWLEIRPDLGCVISGSIDGMILVWDIHHGDVIREFRLRSSLGVRSAAFCPSPGSDRFACIEGHNVAIWDIRGRRIAALNGPTTISAYAWTPDGKHLLSTYAYARSSTKDDVPVLHLWATADDGDNYRLIDTMLAPSFSEPQKSQGLLMQKANVGGPLEKTFMQYAQDLPNHVKGLFFSPGSAVFIVSIGKPKFNDTTGHDRREVQCRIQHWDMESSPRSSRDIKKDTQISVCAFSPVPFPSSIIPISAARLPGPFKYDDPQNTHSDTSWVSPTPCDCFAVGFASGEVEMIYLRRSVGLKESPGNYAFRTALYRHDAMVTSIVFHERLLLSTSADATFKVVHWVVHRPDKPFKVVTVTGHDDTVNAACFSPNGKFVASVSEDKTVRLWRTSGWSCVATFTEHTAPVTHVAFAPEGDTIWSAARNGTVRRHPFVHLVRGGV
ncbi:WD40-repeat-containing domain protein [Fomes fomentarius]|nr:WD40-repeat-containing domain protein [Fomes fomentarius]